MQRYLLRFPQSQSSGSGGGAMAVSLRVSFWASDIGHCGRQDTETGIPKILCYRLVLFFFLQERSLMLSPEEKEKTSKTWMGCRINDAMLSIPSILGFEIFFLEITKHREK